MAGGGLVAIFVTQSGARGAGERSSTIAGPENHGPLRGAQIVTNHVVSAFSLSFSAQIWEYAHALTQMHDVMC